MAILLKPTTVQPVVQFDVVQCSVVQSDVVQCSVVQSDVVQCNVE